MNEQISTVGTANSKKYTTIKELSDILNVSEKTILRAAEREGIDSTVLPFNTKGGIQNKRVFNEKQATLIKQNIQQHHNLQTRQIDDVTTDYEMELLTQKVLQYHLMKEKELREQLENQKPKIELYDKVIETAGTYSIAETCKLLKLPYGRNILYEKLREKGLLRYNNEPYQQYRTYFEYKIVYNEKIRKNIAYTRVTTKGLEYINKLLKGDE